MNGEKNELAYSGRWNYAPVRKHDYIIARDNGTFQCADKASFVDDFRRCFSKNPPKCR